ncbi:ankyrin repeat-containing protein ITN1-like [Mangifera indica]|uniref:ankyrin repeat-containing protein ITN1-like n=1 Tax=Mangifera indica TaxID=29780 RepID=UPI001CFA79BF|nr:ankyrin repeat-containing protein ITN1-like [Mangifera indica]
MEIQAQEAAQNDTQMPYEASMRGCVATLNTLIQNDPFILHKISLTPFTETPPHISASLGHVEFTKAITVTSSLAAAEGHREIVKELLITNKEVSMVADQDGRIPLHLAAMRGRVEVIQGLISAKPQSILVQIHGETALHSCVKHNHLDALKLFCRWMLKKLFMGMIFVAKWCHFKNKKQLDQPMVSV